MYFCVDGSNNVVVCGNRRWPINLPSFEFSITVESGTLAVHWYKTVDKFWSIDFPWRPQLVDIRYELSHSLFASGKHRDLKEYKVYEIHELFVPWFLRKCVFLHTMYKWRKSTAICFDRDGKATYRRVRTVESWMQRNHLEVVPDAIPRLRVSTESAPTSKGT